MSANINSNNYLKIYTDGLDIKYMIKNEGYEKVLTYYVGNALYDKYNHFTFTFNKNNRFVQLFLNGINVANQKDMPLIPSGLYNYNYIGKLHFNR